MAVAATIPDSACVVHSHPQSESDSLGVERQRWLIPFVADRGGDMTGDPGRGDNTTLLLNRYRVEGLLGEGGLGTVVKAFDTRLKNMRAIKTLKRTLTTDPELFRHLEERFTREAEAGSRMGINPNLVAVYDLVADSDGTSYLILEYVPGGTLADRIKESPLPLADALRLTADAARGLQAAHDVGIVHRDIKPANIFLAMDGRAQVGDFGIAQIDDLSGRTRSTVGHPGTPLYMSPEQAHMTAYVQPATDQYSLGLVLFEMLTEVAYRRLSAQGVAERLAAVPFPVRALIERMTAEQPESRYPSMTAVLTAIQAIQRGVSTADTTILPAAAVFDMRAAGPPGIAVGSPHAPTEATAASSGTPSVNLQPVPPIVAPPSSEQAASSRTHRGALLGVGGVLLVALIAIGAFFALGHRSSSPPVPQTATVVQNLTTTTPSHVAVGATTGAAAATGGTPITPVQSTASAPTANVANSTDTITSDGTPITMKITTPGQKAGLTFMGTSGEVVVAQATKSTFNSCGTTLAILKPDDSSLGSSPVCGGMGFLDQQTLPANGTYTLVINPVGAETGQAIVALYTVVDMTGTITSDGAPVSVKTTTPGQNALLTVTGNADQIVAMQVTKSTFATCGTTITILKSDDSTLGSAPICGGTGFLDQQTLPANGAYTVVINPDGATTGQAIVSLYTVVDMTGTITADGPPVSVKITTPGQNGRFTFTGTSGQVVTAQATKSTFSSCGTTFAILKPDDSSLGSAPICGGVGTLDMQTLPLNGTYTLLIDPDGATTGLVSVTITTVPPGQ
jgi:serine/threonine protein kinase